jgi:hypothetical protein
MAWWKNPKCPVCRKKLKKGQRMHEMQMETSDGPHSLEICGDCARFFDMSADAIRNNMSKRFEKQRQSNDKSV